MAAARGREEEEEAAGVAARGREEEAAASSAVESYTVMGTRFDVVPRYALTKPLGHGAYGVVCAAVDRRTGGNVAVKKISRAFANASHTKRTLREIRILRHFAHENVIRLVDVMRPPSFEAFDDVYVLTELMETDLHQIIASGQQLTEEHIVYFLYQILRGLKYIHSAHVLHRDLKPSNLLLNANCELKICDFGLARVAEPGNRRGFLTEYVATRWYRAPEVMLSWKQYTQAIDMWSVGCIFGELLGGRPLFQGKDYMHQLHLVFETIGTPAMEDTEFIASPKAKEYVQRLPHHPGVPWERTFPNASEGALDLLRRMLHFNPDRRITVAEALAHPYLAKLHDPSDEPEAEHKFNFSHEDDEGITTQTLKELMWEEIRVFHPDVPERPFGEHMRRAREAERAHTDAELQRLFHERMRQGQQGQQEQQREWQQGGGGDGGGDGAEDEFMRSP